MKVCFVGLGSIGKRHLNNLLKLDDELNLNLEIHAYRQSYNIENEDIKKKVKKIFNEIEDADCDYDVTFICNPTYKHFETINLFLNRTKNMFIEKPLGFKLEEEFLNIPFDKRGIYYVAAPLKFNPAIEFLKVELKNTSVFAVRAICSSYLPEWRFGRDYRDCYSAKKEEGGGVALDLIHEWDYLRYLFGDPDKMFSISGKFSNLEIDSDDISIYIAEYADKTIELHLDYFGRYTERGLTIYTQTDTIYADIKNNIIYYKYENKRISFEQEDMYEKEMRYYINLVLQGGENKNTVQNAYQTMKIANGRV